MPADLENSSDGRSDCGCRWVTVHCRSGDGMDGEFVPCDRHAVPIDLAELQRTGWTDLEDNPW